MARIVAQDSIVTDDLVVTDDLTVTDSLTVNGNCALGNATSDLIALWGATATGQPSATNQAAVTTNAFSTLTLSATNVSTAAFFLVNSTQVSDLAALVNQATVRAAALTTLVNQLRTDLVASGNIKGSA